MVVQPILNHTIGAFDKMQMYAVMNDARYEVGTSDAIGAHIHSCYEIYVNFSGDISFFHDSTVYGIQPYDVIVSAPGDVHHCIYHSSCRHAHACIWFVSEEVGAFLARRGIRGKISLPREDAERVPRLLRRLSNAEADPFLRAARLMEFLALLDNENSTAAKGTEDFPEVVGKMLSYIDQHLTEISGWESLSQEFFLSKSAINRLFGRHVGISVGRLIEAKRLSYAEKLLRADLSVTDACYRAGFSDCSRFIAAFKKKFGQTPLKYKQALFEKK